MKIFIASLWLALCCLGAELNAATYYVAINGNDSTGNGSFNNPWRTVRVGVNHLTAAGDILLIRGGLYRELSGGILINSSGTAAQPITVYSDGASAAGWVGLIPTVVTDSTLNSSVLSFSSIGTGRLKDIYGQSWNNSKQQVISWKAKSSDAYHAYAIYLKTKAGVFKTIKYYSSYTAPNFNNPNVLRFPLGPSPSVASDGNWHTYAFDLRAALKQALPTDEIDFIDCFYAECTSSSYVDDIRLIGEPSKSTYSDGTGTVGWTYYTPTVEFDSTLNSSVLKFSSSLGTARLFNSSGQSWHNTTQSVISWKAKAAGGNYYYVYLKTKAGAFKTLAYYSWYTTPDLSNPSILRFPLGPSSSDGNWHTYVFDVRAALKQALPTDEIDYIDCFYVGDTTVDVYVDDIELHNTIESAKASQNCIGEWNFNEACGTKVEDTSGTGRHGTLTYMSVDDPRESDWVMGRITKALQFGTNTNSRVSIPSLSTSYYKGMTVSAWVKYENITDTDKAIASGLTGSSSGGLFQNGSGISFQANISGTQVTATSSSGYIAVGEWAHVAAAVDMSAKTITLYINGVVRGTQSFTQTSLDAGANPMHIGNGSALNNPFLGCIDDVKLYNRPLATEEITYLAE